MVDMFLGIRIKSVMRMFVKVGGVLILSDMVLMISENFLVRSIMVRSEVRSNFMVSVSVLFDSCSLLVLFFFLFMCFYLFN